MLPTTTCAIEEQTHWFLSVFVLSSTLTQLTNTTISVLYVSLTVSNRNVLLNFASIPCVTPLASLFPGHTQTRTFLSCASPLTIGQIAPNANAAHAANSRNLILIV